MVGGGRARRRQVGVVGEVEGAAGADGIAARAAVGELAERAARRHRGAAADSAAPPAAADSRTRRDGGGVVWHGRRGPTRVVGIDKERPSTPCAAAARRLHLAQVRGRGGAIGRRGVGRHGGRPAAGRRREDVGAGGGADVRAARRQAPEHA